MSSGSYFPPPVKAVEIPKPHGGGTRILGVPTVADRIAQTVVARRLEAKVEPIFHPDSYGYRPNRSALDAVAACRQRCWKTRLGDRSGHPEVLRQRRSRSHGQSGGGPRRCSVGGAVCEAVAHRADAAHRRDLAAARPGHPAGVRGLAGAGQPVHALRVRRLDGPGIPGRPVRTVRRRCGRALRRPNAKPAIWSRRSGTGWNRSGCGCIPTRRRSSTARTQTGELDYEHTAFTFLGFTFRARRARGQERERSSPRSSPRSARTP